MKPGHIKQSTYDEKLMKSRHINHFEYEEKLHVAWTH